MFFFRKPTKGKPLISDFHSHLIPEIDDGVKDYASAAEIIGQLKKLGIRTIVTTPHISQHAFPNTAEKIRALFSLLKAEMGVHAPDIELYAAAEYYLDDQFQNRIANDEQLLTFGRQHLLFETNYLSEPYQLKEIIFQLITRGYRPMLAHPERYLYMTIEKATDLRSRGVNLQLNLLSLIGYYSGPVQRMAERLIDAQLINAVSSDCHNPEQARLLERVVRNKYYQRVLDLPLLNFDLNS